MKETYAMINSSGSCGHDWKPRQMFYSMGTLWSRRLEDLKVEAYVPRVKCKSAGDRGKILIFWMRVVPRILFLVYSPRNELVRFRAFFYFIRKVWSSY